MKKATIWILASTFTLSLTSCGFMLDLAGEMIHDSIFGDDCLVCEVSDYWNENVQWCSSECDHNLEDELRERCEEYAEMYGGTCSCYCE